MQKRHEVRRIKGAWDYTDLIRKRLTARCVRPTPPNHPQITGKFPSTENKDYILRKIPQIYISRVAKNKHSYLATSGPCNDRNRSNINVILGSEEHVNTDLEQ